MKPQFALDLSNTSIRLLHLQGGKEVELGAVSLDDPAFDQRVHDLYRIAEEHAKGRVRTLLLIPNSEVLYTRVETGPGDRATRARKIGEALEGMTPYKLDELVFDWRADGEEAVVAAVATLTLEEAESFATERGFNPLGFSSRPMNGAFKGIPDFGESKLAKARKAGAPWPARPEPPAPPPAPEAETAPEADTATEQPTQMAAEPGAETTTEDAPAPEATKATVSDQPRPTPAKAETSAPPSAVEAATLDPEPPAPEETAEASAQTDLFAEPEPPTGPVLPTDQQPAPAEAEQAPLSDTLAAPAADEAAPAPEDVTPATARSALADDSAPVPAEDSAPTAKADPAPQPGPDRDPADIALDDVPPPRGFRPYSATPNSDSEPAKADADAVDALSPGAASRTASDRDEPVDKSEGARKRGAGRTTATNAKAKAKADRKAKPETSAPAEPAPAFSTRRQPAPTPAAEALDDTPPRPATLPPIGSAPPGASTPRRPKIPPHLAKPVSGPNARSTPKTPPLTKFSEGPKPAKGSRLSQLMARLQNTPDGGEGVDVSPAPIPDLPKPPERAQPKTGKARTASAQVPIHELPLPKSRPLPPKPPRATAGLPDPGAASASLTPGAHASGKRQGGTPLPPPRTLSRGGLNEAEAMTLFGARGETRERPLKPVLIFIAVVLVLAVSVWAGVFLLGRGPAEPTATDSGALGLGEPVTGELDADASPPADTVAPENVEVAALPPAEENDTPPALPQSDVAVLTGPDDVTDVPAVGAGDNGRAAAIPPSVAPAPEIDSTIGPQETAQPLPEPETRQEAESRYAALGIWQIPPDPPILPEAGRIDDLRLAALAGTTEFADAPNLSEMPKPVGLTPPAAPTPPAPLVFEEPPAPVVTEPAEAEVAALPAAPVTPAEPVQSAPGQAPAGDGVPLEAIRVTQGAPAVIPPERPARPNSLRDIVPVNPANGPDLRPRQRPDTLNAQQETALQPSDTAAETETVTAPGSTVALAAAGPSTAEAARLTQPAEALPVAPGAPDQADVIDARPAAQISSPDIRTGEPAVRPRARPAGTEVAATEATVNGTDPLRPLPRPGTVTRAETDLGTTGSLVAQDAATADDATLASTAGLLHAPSPPARPASFASLATTPDAPETVTDAPAPAADDPAADLAEANAPLPESPYAVIASRKPRNRPASLERDIEKARAKAGPPVTASAAVKPTAPTTATVAKTATEANVLNLARLNLIGVYGGNSDRRALIRLPSGRFVKVEVGDRLDGGRVASISEHELSYVKGGRNITLKMPRG